MFVVKDGKLCVTMAEQMEKSANTEFPLPNFSIAAEQLRLPLAFPTLSSLSVRGKAECAVQRTLLECPAGILGAAASRNHENITESSLGVGVAVILPGGDNSRPG